MVLVFEKTVSRISGYMYAESPGSGSEIVLKTAHLWF